MLLNRVQFERHGFGGGWCPSLMGNDTEPCPPLPCCALTMPGGVRPRRTYVSWRRVPPIGAPVSASLHSTRSPKRVAPHRSPSAPVVTRRPCWSGCTSTTSAAPRRWPTGARAAVPPLPGHRGSPRGGSPCGPAGRGQPPPSRSRSETALDAAAVGRLRAGSVRSSVLPRDHPCCPASARPVVAEGTQAARPR